mgnify:CR=1 FL=1
MEMLQTAGLKLPRMGLGTWYLGESVRKESAELEALRTGIELGITLFDTAEMYGDGGAERLLGKAIKPYDRSKLQIVSKVYPHNAGRNHIFQSCENSLRRLGTDYLDVYLLHWRGSVPLTETVDCMEELKAQGKIRAWGVSNLDTDDMDELEAVRNGGNCALDQVLYHLGSRGIEYDLLPWTQQRGMPVMTYCPLAQGGRLRRGLLGSSAVKKTAEKYQATPIQILLAFVLYQDNTIAIPRSGSAAHVRELVDSLRVTLTAEDIALLSKDFPAPTRKTYLDIV